MSRRASSAGLHRGRLGDASGQALLELALVVPILVLLVMAIFQIAFVMESQFGLTNAVREAARRIAATEPSAPPDWGGTTAAWVQTQLCGGSSPPCTAGLLDQNVQAFDGTKLNPVMPTVSFCSYDAAGIKNYRVQVDVTYGHPLFFGPMAVFTDAVDGNAGNGLWDLSASAQMRLENIDDTDPLFSDPGACPP